jgi:hypothetical protein
VSVVLFLLLVSVVLFLLLVSVVLFLLVRFLLRFCQTKPDVSLLADRSKL